MASTNTTPVNTFPQAVDIKLTIKAEDQDDLDYITTNLEKGFAVDLIDRIEGDLSLTVLTINDKVIPRT